MVSYKNIELIRIRFNPDFRKESPILPEPTLVPDRLLQSTLNAQESCGDVGKQIQRSRAREVDRRCHTRLQKRPKAERITLTY